jgi:hypothetical protein
MGWYVWVAVIQLVFSLLGGVLGWMVVEAEALWPFSTKKTATKREKRIGYLKGVLSTGATMILADVMIKMVSYAPGAFEKVMQLLGLQITQLLIGAGVVIVGYLAYRFKRANLLAYGSVEIMFAAAVAIVTAKQMSGNTSWAGPAATLGGAIYVVSRGLGNYAEGAKQRAGG